MADRLGDTGCDDTQAPGFDPLRDDSGRAALLEMMFHNAPVGIAFVDRAFRFVRVNEVFAAIHARSAPELVGKSVQEIAPQLWPELDPIYRRVLSGETLINSEISGVLQSTDGEVRHWIASHYPLSSAGEVLGIGLIVNDVTARRVSEEALRTRNNLYAMLSRTNKAVSQCRTREDLFQEICTIAVHIGQFRYAWVGVPDGNRIKKVVSAGQGDDYLEQVVISLDEDDPRSHGPTGRAALTGNWYVVNDFMASTMTRPWHEAATRAGFAASAGFPLKQQGVVVAVLTMYAGVPGFFTEELVTTLSEITPSVSFALDALAEEGERRRAQEALHDREEQLRLLLDSTAEAICGIDVQGYCTFANRACAQILGLDDPGELSGRRLRDVIQPAGPDEVPFEAGESAIHGGIQADTGRRIDGEVFHRADGTPFDVEGWSHPMRRGGQIVGAVVTFVDVTDRKRLEGQLRQAQKMEAVGRLAGGVAHDFNNLLGVIIGYSELVLLSLVKQDPHYEEITQIRIAGERAAVLTRQLLVFSRKHVLQPELLDLNQVISESMKMLLRVIGEDVELAFVPGRDVGLVKADLGQIEQVIMNLVVNARDAMPSGGQITIETAIVDPDAMVEAPGSPGVKGPYAMLAVSDSGCGMDTVTVGKIFEPFFTTKPEGKGTGLGLSTVYGIVEESSGKINVYSEVDVGTTFKIYLPCSEGLARERGVAGSGTLAGGPETILLVEDNEALRVLTMRVLAEAGYNVLAAEGGAEALAVARQHPGTIALVLTDIVMPQLSGRKLAEELARMRPAIKVLYMSGFTDDAIVRHGILQDAVEFISKPFTAHELTRRVRQVLNDSSAANVKEG